jgi:hypothetical protein
MARLGVVWRRSCVPNRGQPCLLGNALDGVGDVLGVELAAVLAGAHEPRVLPCPVRCGALDLLLLAPPAKNLESCYVQ